MKKIIEKIYLLLSGKTNERIDILTEENSRLSQEHEYNKSNIQTLQKQQKTLSDELTQLDKHLSEVKYNYNKLSSEWLSAREIIQNEQKHFKDFSENIKNNNIEMQRQRESFNNYKSEYNKNELLMHEHQLMFENYSINLKNNNQLMDRMIEEIKQMEKKSDGIERGLISLQKEINYLKKAGPINIQTEKNKTATAPEKTYYSIDYLDFENNFRGSRAEIKDRQRQYLPYFQNKRKVLDIGCGRGEFLELLSEEGIEAQGVDFYEDFVLYCTSLGLKATYDEGVHFLNGLEKVDGIFAGQIVEHMTISQILELCDVAYKKLESGSYLVIETPNPTSLSIYANAFYIDPSHVKPVHPLTMKYILAKSGFTNIKIIYTDNSELAEIPMLQSDKIDNLDEFNKAIKRVSNLLFGSQDYAIIARKE